MLSPGLRPRRRPGSVQVGVSGAHDRDVKINATDDEDGSGAYRSGLLGCPLHTAKSSNLTCRGSGKVWDPWFAEKGFDHVVGTWELMLDTAWIRSFTPNELRPQKTEFDGELHALVVAG